MAAKANDVLEFDGPSHTYTLNGRRVPSVTEVLEPYSGLEWVRPELVQAAADFGHNVHVACDLYDADELDHEALDPALTPYVDAWDRFQRDTGAVAIESELAVYSRTLRYAGTLDRIMALGRKERVQIDIKTSTGVPRTVGAQTAAYENCYREMFGRKLQGRYCCHLKPDGTYKLHPLTDATDFAKFQSCLTLWRAGWIYSAKRA